MEKFVLLTILLVILILIKPAIVAGRVILLISQEFPQIPVKPLHYFTEKPTREEFVLTVNREKVNVDLFAPTDVQKHPAVIIAMGVKTEDKDKKLILDFSETLARLGFVVMWPRLDALITDEKMIEDPSTFVEAFTYLEGRDEVDKKWISFVGFSVGSSLALVAAESPTINEKVHGFVFFGGYYNIFDYLTALATEIIIVDGNPLSWQPAEGATSHAQKILEREGLSLEQFKNTSPGEKLPEFLQYSPDKKIENLRARIFILHHREDPYVPFVESIKLKEALNRKMEVDFHLSNLFTHAQVKQGFALSDLMEFTGLFGFIYKVFMFL